MSSTPVLDRALSVAPPGFDRWRVPPSAIAALMACGQLLALPVIEPSLASVIGVTEPDPGDWSPTSTSGLVPAMLAFLGLTAFVAGRWIDDVGPRKAMAASAACMAGGLVVAAIGVALHELWLVYAGYAVLGGIGCGLGYVAPTTTLINWFPDRPGAVTGLVIAGFGAGAWFGAAFAEVLLGWFSSATDSGVVPTLVALGIAHGVMAIGGAATIRIPPPGWVPRSYTSQRRVTGGVIAHDGAPPRAMAPRVGTPAGRSDVERRPVAKDVHAAVAVRTRQFWLVWVILCINAMVGIGLLEHAGQIVQVMFPVLIGPPAAQGFSVLLGIAAPVGGFAWAVASDETGRRRTWMTMLLAGAALLAFLPVAARMGNAAVFTVAAAAFASVYGAGFTTLPAYARDLFGDMHVGAIHGRLLSAWPVAAIAGPFAWDAVHDLVIGAGRDSAAAHAMAMYAMAAMLVAACGANWLVQSVSPVHHHRAPEPAPSAAGRARAP